jgi:hypothetical protein
MDLPTSGPHLSKQILLGGCVLLISQAELSVGMYDAKISRVMAHFLCCANYPQFVKTAGATCEENSQL